MHTSLSLDSLPNELLLDILSCLPTGKLLKISSLSRHFHLLIFQILKSRLLAAASLGDHNLVLECYRPAAGFGQPTSQCQYIGTDGLDCVRPGDVSKLYSRFRPVKRTVERKVSRHPAGDVPGSRTHPGDRETQAQSASAPPAQTRASSSSEPVSPPSSSLRNSTTVPIPPVTQNIHVQRDELFTQLCAAVHLVHSGPNMGLVHTRKVSEGVVRLWRDFLADATVVDCVADAQSEAEQLGQLRKPPEKNAVVWLNDGPLNVGLSVTALPLTLSRSNGERRSYFDEEEDASYEVTLNELWIRSTHLLMATEKSLEERRSAEGRGVVIMGRSAEVSG